jgi:hypothetical protein
MAIAAHYFDLVREMKDAYNHRLRLVESAKQIGIRPTAQLFATTVPAVRKWLRRFKPQGPSGLRERYRARDHQPHKTPPGQCRVRFANSATLGSLRRLAARSGLADR